MSPAMSGREWLEEYQRTEGAAPLSRLMNMRISEVGDGVVKFEGQPNEAHFNPQGIVHGGYAATMLDSAMGCAAQTRMPKRVSYVTLEMKLNYVRPILGQGETVYAEGRIVNAGRRIITTEGRIENAEGKLLAHGTATMMITE